MEKFQVVILDFWLFYVVEKSFLNSQDDPERLTFSCSRQKDKFFVKLSNHFEQIFKIMSIRLKGNLDVCFYDKNVAMMVNNNVNLTKTLTIFLSSGNVKSLGLACEWKNTFVYHMEKSKAEDTRWNIPKIYIDEIKR